MRTNNGNKLSRAGRRKRLNKYRDSVVMIGDRLGQQLALAARLTRAMGVLNPYGRV